MADKHIRIDSQFSTVSAFWKPESPEIVQTGNLAVDERRITFTTAPEYRTVRTPGGLPGMNYFHRSGKPLTIPAMQGFTGNGLCTLCQLIEVNSEGLTHYALEQSIMATSFRAAACVLDLHLGGFEDKCLHSAHYSFTGLSDWLPKSIGEEWQKDHILIRIPLVKKELTSFSILKSGLSVSINIFSELTSSESNHARINRSVAYIEVKPLKAECLRWYLDIGNRLENLFSLLIGASLGLETMFVYRGEERGTVLIKRQNDIKHLDSLDRIPCSISQFAKCIAIWMSESEEFKFVENLLLGVLRQGKLFVETEFLSLAQALEGFHRATVPQPTKRSLALRLNDLCHLLSESLLLRMKIDSSALVKIIPPTRNFYTHVASRRRPQDPIPTSAVDLFLLNQKMRSLLRGVMMLHLGLSEDQISDVLVREAT